MSGASLPGVLAGSRRFTDTRRLCCHEQSGLHHPPVSVGAEGTAVTRDLRAGLGDTGIIAARNISECKHELPKLEEAILLS